MSRCERCFKEAFVTTGSIFNTAQICMKCADKESVHPRYEEAREAKMLAVKGGDYNFPGIGLPGDFKS